ncbi:NAD(P)-dependent dehydrogenase (short-subunit alcohol dehydrogenase family) [Rhizobium leguminosarum]|uniref:NAD(P)-dependent dehydrogenase (Short-subunit alcohol dehydrogenase family) n=1 Tax=Rhizobium leguminosarum TaxID=384 RepID=A0A7Z0IXN6_RHILE|nr:SDR family oxidoreductase [Rhizobium leguminosarum]NYJ11032.1 NAD(P)-dependent dehydrogenase (short-subunit alcohol dehydrogenase family) [Rhizobium leguminosarum]
MTFLVTGAAGGIGRAICETLSEQGHGVLGQDIVAGERVDADLVGDLCDARFLEKLGDRLTSTEVKAVVVGHGIAGAGRLEEMCVNQARRIMTINFESVIRLWDLSQRQLEATNGTFVVVISQAGLVGEAGNALYCASKFALSGWMRGVGATTKVRLRAINPGGIRTPLLEQALHDMAKARGITYEQFVETRYGTSPAGRIAEPAEVGDLVAIAIALKTPALVEAAITGGEVLW